jgi:hypothetical protein
MAAENGMNQANPPRPSTKKSLLHNKKSIDPHQNHPKSFMGGIKSSCDD